MQEIELKPCPFCGSENVSKGSTGCSLGHDLYIKCLTCGAKIQICEEYGEEDLVNRWNRRTWYAIDF